MSIFAPCPVCLSKIEVSQNPEIGHRLECPNCKTDLDIVWLYPVTFDLHEDFVKNDPDKIENTQSMANSAREGTKRNQDSSLGSIKEMKK